jgi:hypothetical protein
MSGFRWLDPLPELSRTVRIPISSFAKYEAELGRNIRQEVFGKAMRTAGKGVREMLEQETIRRKIFYKKHFARGWRAELGNAASSVRVYNRQPYAIIVERGRRAGARQPPVAALVPWVRDKFGLRGAEARRVAFLVARKISERGIAGRPVLRDPKVQLKIQRVVARTVVTKLRAAIMRTRAR